MALVCDWAVLCERAYFEAPQHRSLSLSKIIEQAVVDALPATIGPFMIVAHLDGYGEGMQVALRAIRPNRAEARVRIAGFEHAGPYVLLMVESLGVQEEGLHGLEMLFDGGKLTRTLQLAVTRTPPAETHVH